MLKKKVKIELSNEEQRIILYALNELRTGLIQEINTQMLLMKP